MGSIGLAYAWVGYAALGSVRTFLAQLASTGNDLVVFGAIELGLAGLSCVGEDLAWLGQPYLKWARLCFVGLDCNELSLTGLG